ncbi:RagB/SusD family nutrient uptake outer membrane protein [Sphingobacterium pedocola]|uniref:RagB/SusD family nutrient uptake outer membrane protein n=1 Tax=Sphingobacterium pedocola TaxID=2082722 RepID=A0ABR9T9G5_9SPHI|nr:RagB/SusD family nutrient uptake outer membrane protein [Sphingobacterium pedocola]MBE8721991.1 RagB/SusD family nutrient uptake outer membrane protein [Sphingobacterium pedocola]
MKIRCVGLFLMLQGLIACDSYLDIVPDNIATLENAFTVRTQAEKFLHTCYSYMPKNGDLGGDPAMLGGDEIWRVNGQTGLFDIARGLMNIVSPYGDNWESMYRGIRDCNIFLENIENVTDMEAPERARWASEVMFLKAYYHFYLARMYGPIPIVRENLPIGATPEEVKVSRAPMDEVFDYIVELIDESLEHMPQEIVNPMNELGRVTIPIALSIKAKVLVTAASPLFNGNEDQITVKNPDGQALFNPTHDPDKWERAVQACKEAVEACRASGFSLYYFRPEISSYDLTDSMTTQMNIRNSFTERWNSEIVWANTQTSSNSIQIISTPHIDPRYLDNWILRGELSPPMKMAELFYSENGVPITEDKTWAYSDRFKLREATEQDELYIRRNFLTAGLHFDREPRFYANLGFDGGVWYGQGRYDDKEPDNLFFLEGKAGQRNGSLLADRGTVTGYFIKKYIHYQNVIGEGTNYSVTWYPWPIIRLADVYLLYAEALNEYSGPSPEVFEYIDAVRARAGLEGVEQSWSDFSNQPSKPSTKDGLREIIRQERLIEFAFEGQRFWDLRRWKESAQVLNQPITGWDLKQEAAGAYYRSNVVFEQRFRTKDYFWPIKDSYIVVNRNLVQNLGW